MRIINVFFVHIICVSCFGPLVIQAAEIQPKALKPQELNAGSEYMAIDNDDGMPGREEICSPNCGLVKPICCFRHPTTLGYHPPVYDYRYFYNIVGHETCFNSLNYFRPKPALNWREGIPAPASVEGKQSLQSSGSARLSAPNQKKLQK